MVYINPYLLQFCLKFYKKMFFMILETGKKRKQGQGERETGEELNRGGLKLETESGAADQK